MNLWVIFLTGLTVGGLTCLAVQGGLLASVIAARENEEEKDHIQKRDRILPTIAFLSAKLVAYTLLGFILGGFGGVIGINETTQTIMQFVAGTYMILVALNLLEVHPIFRYAVIQPPKFLTRRVRNQSKSKEFFAPLFLGAMTIFIPCGTTLAMEALAISSGNAIVGGAIMCAFILGTTPLFFGLGFVTSLLGENFRVRFLKVAALAVIYLGISSINGSLVSAGSPLTIQSVAEALHITSSQSTLDTTNIMPTSQMVKINIHTNGYSPRYIKVKKGSLVTVTLVNQDSYSCASAFRMPSLGIKKNLKLNESYTFSFTPDKLGKIPFTCSMGMYDGAFEVI